MQKSKNKNIICGLGIFSAFLLTTNVVKAQDTVKTRETTVVHDKEIKAQDKKTLYKSEFGLRYLPTFTSLTFRNVNGDVVRGTAAMSNGFGIMLGHNCSNYLGVQAEINYDKISQSYKDQDLNRKVSINYINVPVLLSINTDKTCPVVFGVVVGPQFGINIGSSMNGKSGNSTDTLHAALAVKQGDVGLAYGAGFGIALSKELNIRLDLGFRGLYGLVNMSGTPTGNNSYNILVKGSRKAYGGYAGITFLF